MNPSQSLARPLLASMFVVGGLDSIRHSESKVKAAEAVTKPLSRAVPAIPSDTETLVKLNGAVQVGAGLLLATGKSPRLAALALIGSIVPTTYAAHRFWEETDNGRRKQQSVHFFKNLGLLGGLILELDSRPKKHKGARKQATRTARAGRRVRSGSTQLAAKTKRLERRAERRAKHAAEEASKFASRAASDVSKRSQKAAKRTGDVAGQYAQAASDHAGQLLSYAQDHLGDLKVA
jgi:putative oxidoreductase